MKAVMFIIPLLIASGGAFVHAPLSTQSSASVPMCTPEQLSLGTDDENGNFDGMSHSGTLLVLRNPGPNACRMTTAPVITLYDKTTRLNVKFTPTTTAGTKSSVIVAAGAELTSSLRWVSNNVYSPGACFTATSLHVAVASRDLSTAISHQLCGEKGKTIQADMSLLATDPVYKPGKASQPGS
jgi:hypothetical protein